MLSHLTHDRAAQAGGLSRSQLFFSCLSRSQPSFSCLSRFLLSFSQIHLESVFLPNLSFSHCLLLKLCRKDACSKCAVTHRCACKVTIAQEEKHYGVQLCGTTLGLLGNHSWICWLPRKPYKGCASRFHFAGLIKSLFQLIGGSHLKIICLLKGIVFVHFHCLPVLRGEDSLKISYHLYVMV